MEKCISKLEEKIQEFLAQKSAMLEELRGNAAQAL
jgi:hypothetical protein